MFFVNFFLVACISALVAGDEYDWVPPTIPSTTRQCEMAGYNSGVCYSAGFNDPEICKNIWCAKSEARWRYRRELNYNTGDIYIPTPIDAMEGTICGSSSVCKGHECVPVPPTKFPNQQYNMLIRGCERASPSTGDNVKNKPATVLALWNFLFGKGDK